MAGFIDNTATAAIKQQTLIPPQHCYLLFHNLQQYIPPPTKTGRSYFTSGPFTYYHYKCDDFDDIGWGCAYRTLQSTCSWINNQHLLLLDLDINTRVSTIPTVSSVDDYLLMPTAATNKRIRIPWCDVPNIRKIQQTLVTIRDKPPEFKNSKEWIGALEVFYVIDAIYGEECRILHIPQSENIKRYVNVIKKYFEEYGGFIMMGGDRDSSSKGIAGIHINNNQAYLLIIDPHYVGTPESIEELIEKKYVRWQHTSDFEASSFYNLCLPQLKAKNLR